MTIIFWHWWILAAALLLAELLAPGVFFLWIAFGAATAGVLALVLPGLGWEADALAMAVTAVAAAWLGRGFYDPRRAKPTDNPALNQRGAAMIGRVVRLEQAIVNGNGRVRLGGTWWTVHGEDMPAGAAVRVIGSEGAVLLVRDGSSAAPP